jgi:hypothetical protein
VPRNILGLVALLLVYYVPDRFYLGQRPFLQQITPYILIVGLYAWIVFHNRVLFDRFYLAGKKREYFMWTALIMIIGSINMHLTIVYGFNEVDSLSRILSFWIFTVTGLGVYVLFRYRNRFNENSFSKSTPAMNSISHFIFSMEGTEYNIPVEDILYAESLENYVRLVTTKRKYLIRLSLKEAEQRLPQPGFLRISRSHIVNTSRIGSRQPDVIQVGDQELKIGKIYKRFVEEKLK